MYDQIQKYKYHPSNFTQAEINAINTQIKAHQKGAIPLSETEISRLKSNLKSQQEFLKKALDYEKEKRYGPNGYSL